METYCLISPPNKDLTPAPICPPAPLLLTVKPYINPFVSTILKPGISFAVDIGNSFTDTIISPLIKLKSWNE